MSEVVNGLLYSEEHEWVQTLEGDLVRIGITEFAQHQLGDIVFVELPESGTEVSSEDSIGTIESVKTVSDLFAPVSGTVVRVNEQLQDEPELVNSAPYGEGWMIEIKVNDDIKAALAKLMDADAYRAHTAE
ncbi:glycine cleavage system protein GcvH [Paenibacillus sp. Marseille-Q4541]|uniref:glycine cleavage system protein GcvH n=1 Tax=Paenibacillus sp. Marseille-Q4541 TaxID=2831522 RepID=UPI001BAB17BE|nr:glycine cleavage system protein GcvH [Paenibacillus sp. Marseille-Q4541]